MVDDQDSAALCDLLLIGGSPQGARPKALVQFDPPNRQACILPGTPNSPCFVKFPIHGENTEMCAMELFNAHLTRQCRFDVQRMQYFDLGKAGAAFGIELRSRRAHPCVGQPLGGSIACRLPYNEYQLRHLLHNQDGTLVADH